MKTTQPSHWAYIGILLGFSLALAASAQADESQDPRSACQQQVKEYEIAAEQAQDYIRDCIASLGGTEDSGQGSWEAPSDTQEQPLAISDDSDGSSGEREQPE